MKEAQSSNQPLKILFYTKNIVKFGKKIEKSKAILSSDTKQPQADNPEGKPAEKKEEIFQACVKHFLDKASDINLALIENENMKESLEVALTIVHALALKEARFDQKWE